MKALVAVLVLCAACSKTKIKECEDLVRLSEKIEKCEQLPASARQSMTPAIKSMKDALKQIEDVGDQASKEQIDTLASSCKRQHDSLVRLYEKSAPECIK